MKNRIHIPTGRNQKVSFLRVLHRLFLNRRAFLLTALAILIAAPVARATSDTWSGATSGAWSLSGNWSSSPATVPGTGDTATFNNAGNANTTLDLGTGVTISSILFDTASAAAYTIGSGAVGSQALTLNTAGAITLNSGVANNQLFNANLNLNSAASATAAMTNNSASLLTIAGGIVGNVASGNGLLTVSGSGDTTVAGAVTKPGAGSLALLKTGAGKLTLGNGSTWTGTGASQPKGSGTGGNSAFTTSFIVQEGTLLLNGGTHSVTGEAVIGGISGAHGGVGQNAKIQVDSGSLTISAYLSVGRGNGVGAVSSDLILNNAAAVTCANTSLGYNGGNALNLPKGSLTMGSTATFTVSGNGVFNLAESAGSEMTATLNNSAQIIASGSGIKYIGNTGSGSLTLNDSSSVNFGSGAVYVGNATGGAGTLTLNGSSSFTTTGEIQIPHTGINGSSTVSGTVNVSGGTLNVGGMTPIRNNNNAASSLTGTVNLSSGTINVRTDSRAAFQGSGSTGTINITGGTYNQGTVNSASAFAVTDVSGTGIVNLSGSGSLNMLNNALLRFAWNAANASSGTFNQNGGTVTFYSDAGTTVGGTGSVDLQVAGTASSVSTYNLNGGTLTTPQIKSTTTTGTRTFNFNGGTLKPTASTATFMNLGTGTAVANVRDGGAVIDSNGKDITIAQALLHSSIGGDAVTDGGLIKAGAGKLTLTGTSTYNGATIIKNGAIVLGSGGSINSSPSITVSNGAIFDVSAVGGGFTLGSSQSLFGGGVVTGAVTTASSATSKIYAGTDGGAETLSFSNNLTVASSSTFNLDVSTSASSGNDTVVVAGTLTLNATTFNVRALSGAANLAPTDYVLVTSPNTISGSPNSSITWVGTPPANAANFTVVNTGNTVVLHYAGTVVNPPAITSATANPSTLARGASTLITAAVTQGSGAVTSVTVSGAALSSTVTLVSDGTGNYTNNATIAAGAAAGSQTLTVLATDVNSLAASSNITVTVTVQSEIWNGGGSDNKWTTGGNWTPNIQPAAGGDSVFFAGTIQMTANMDASFSVAALTFNANAGSFTITNAANTLTLTGSVTNNSPNSQTIDVPIALSGSQTINAASGNVAISRTVSGSGSGLIKVGSGALTLSGVNTYNGATTVGSGTLTIGGSGQLGGGTYSANITNNGALNVGTSAGQTLSGTISGTGSLTNSGAGTLTLSAANTYSGGTTLNAGTLLVQGSSTPTSVGSTVTSGPLGTGTLTLNGGTFGFAGTSGYTIANNVTVAGATSIEVASGQNEVLNGNWSGNGNLTLVANGTTGQWQLGGDNSGYTGTFTQNSGNTSLAFNSALAGSASAAWVFNNNGNQRQRLNFGAGTISFGSLAGNGLMANIAASGTATVSVGALNTSTTFTGTLGGTTTGQAQNINLLKVGSGSLTLSAANNHTGTTTINAGELIGQTGGSCASSAVTVAAGATNGVKVAAANGQWTCASLAYGSGANYADFDFNSQTPSITAAPLNITGNLTTNGTVQVIVRNGSFTPNTSYPLMTWGGTGPGSLAAFAKPIGTVGTLQLSGNTINLKAGIYVPNLAFTNATGISRQIAISDIVTAGLVSSQGGSPTYTITLPGGTSAQGGSVITDGTRMLYTPSGTPASDSFSYTVSDGVASATATVTITFGSVAGAQINAALIGNDGADHARFTFHGIPNYPYHVQRATTLSPANWTNADAGVTTGADGSYLWTDTVTVTSLGGTVYYRISYP